ncbi:hypothetical protein ACET3Z_027150 [Daucus carota]
MTAMTSLNALPSARSVYAAYASISSSVMLLRSTCHQIVLVKFKNIFSLRSLASSTGLLTLIVEKDGRYKCSGKDEPNEPDLNESYTQIPRIETNSTSIKTDPYISRSWRFERQKLVPKVLQ